MLQTIVHLPVVVGLEVAYVAYTRLRYGILPQLFPKVLRRDGLQRVVVGHLPQA